MYHIITFLSWTLLIYWAHRLAHVVPVVRDMHADHHAQVASLTYNGMHWTNIFLYFDSWKSTADQWITEVIPTIVFCAVTGQWWLGAAYFIWAAFIQEGLEHNPGFNIYPILTSGKWHLLHHTDHSKNFGVFFPIWDMLFGTHKTMS